MSTYEERRRELRERVPRLWAEWRATPISPETAAITDERLTAARRTEAELSKFRERTEPLVDEVVAAARALEHDDDCGEYGEVTFRCCTCRLKHIDRALARLDEAAAR